MDKIIPIRLSHSSLNLLHECERKFQLEKIFGQGRDETADLVFGKAYGVGVAIYLSTQDQDLALYKAWLEYFPELESEKKSMTKCFALLLRSFPALDNLLQDYEIVYYKDKPAAELSFRMNISEKFYFVGHIDMILQNRATGAFTVLEVKHTGLLLEDLRPVYSNSGQALGYSIALDAITNQKQNVYEVLYFVGQLSKTPYETSIKKYSFTKTILDRLQWFLTLGIDVDRILKMQEIGIWPKRGSSCLSYNRPCFHYQTCSLTSLDREVEQKEDTIEYDFTFDMEELINEHIDRVQNERLEQSTLIGIGESA